MAFWRERQADLDRKLKERRKQLTGVIAPVAQTIRGGGGGVGGKRRAEAPVGRGGNGEEGMCFMRGKLFFFLSFSCILNVSGRVLPRYSHPFYVRDTINLLYQKIPQATAPRRN